MKTSIYPEVGSEQLNLGTTPATWTVLVAAIAVPQATCLGAEKTQGETMS